MYYYVYLLIAINKKKPVSYVGYTKNLSNRIKLHNSGKGAKFTKGSQWKLVYSKKYNSKNKALSEEYKLKKNYILRSKIKKKFFEKH